MGIGSNKHDLVGMSLINLQLSSLTSSKALKAGGNKEGASVEEPEEGTIFRSAFCWWK